MVVTTQRNVLLAAVIAIFGATAAQAASPITTAFLANVQANTDFLDHSSVIASGHAKSETIRAFAMSEAPEQAHVASALLDLPPAVLASTDQDIATGRSVAIDGPARQAANGRPPMTQSDVGHLHALSGRAFDDFYWTKQLDALSQLESDYRTYIAHGDDPALVAMAKSQLPRVLNRLILLSKI